MLEFSENKSKKREQKIERKAKDQPAWVDKHEANMEVDISKQSRLRKLKTTEKEDVVGGAEYSKRLVTQFTNTSSLFDWARPKEEELVVASDSDEDPISKLLKSNTSVFTQ
jgi:hypothetical protein